MVKTWFQAKVPLKIPNGISGGGWNAKNEFLHVPVGEVIEVITAQVPQGPVCNRIIICYDKSRCEQLFETLGRLVASGAVFQIFEHS